MAAPSSSTRKCTDCGGTQFVMDHHQGDLVCKNCGLVAEAHMIDERSEWRTFSDKDKEGQDPNRVGGPGNPLLDGGGLTTMIGKSRDGDGTHALNRLHMRNNNPDRALTVAFKKLSDLCDKLSISNKTVHSSACEIYKKAMDSQRLKGRGTNAICAACLYLACRQSSTPRSFKDITAVMPPEVAKKDIGRCFKEIVEVLKASGGQHAMTLAPTASHPADHMKRFAADLSLPFPVLKICQDMARNARPEGTNANFVWDARSPLSIAAAVIFIVTQLKCAPSETISMQDLCMVTNVSEGTIRGVYKDMYPSIRNLLPPGAATEQQLARLPVPEMRGGAGPLRMD
ncbi:hypothetical protein V8C86DRAFT_2714153 [Haematococcus lacustris]